MSESIRPEHIVAAHILSGNPLIPASEVAEKALEVVELIDYAIRVRERERDGAAVDRAIGER